MGALDSAMRGVCQMLARFGLKDEKEKLQKEFKEPGEIDDETMAIQVALGRLRPEDQPTKVADVPALAAEFTTADLKVEVPVM